jgi:enediyne biosynthesis protein E4
MINRPHLLLILIIAVYACACSKSNDQESMFRLLQPEETGILFNNQIEETDSFNILTEEYIYNGGGVGIADFNNDGLSDIFFSGNQVPNKLYLNEGDFKFTDITEKAGINIAGMWNQGVAIVDINNDGWKDIYVSVTMHPDSLKRPNMLFVNQGVNKEGTPSFKEEAASYGINDMGYCVNSAFIDYDKDGDLDLYVLVNRHVTNAPTNYRLKILDGTAQTNDRFYRNNGNGTFTNVTKEAGITIEGYGLGISVCDFNKDGWPDIYVSNDFLTNDILYMNQKNGTFKNMMGKYIKHHSQFSMGNDAADFNNDARPDIVTLDMLPEIYDRKKTTIGNKSYLTYINNEKYGYEYQYARNMLQMNNGLEEGIAFSEIGQLSGIYQTEWSWSPLMVDFDNDGYRDIVVTNGFPKDITDRDFIQYRQDVGNFIPLGDLVDSIPVVKIPNYAFKNNGDLTFTDVSSSWGLNKESFSNGASFADLDNDGDLDYVVNNINDVAFVYENTLYSKTRSAGDKTSSTAHYLRLQLTGPEKNRGGYSTKVTIKYNGKQQYHDHSVYRGFLSSVEEVIHFGLGDVATVDSLIVEWPDGRGQLILNVKADQLLKVDYKNATDMQSRTPLTRGSLVTKNNSVLYKHNENDLIDYNVQRTIPHKFSQRGPGISVADINKDGLEDFLVGGSSEYPATLFRQQKNGSFSMTNPFGKSTIERQEDQGCLFFDADNDGDPDLYMTSGGFGHPANSEYYQDRFYRNDGNGNFKFDGNAIPSLRSSKSCVRAADFDSDGDLDLFVAGRVIPGEFPYPAASYLLKNTNGKFADVTEEVCSPLKTGGLITDALWTDFNNDNKIDLILVGEFMPIKVFMNVGNKLTLLEDSGLEDYSGSWNSIAGGDFDHDNDIDYIVGNIGLNNYYHPTKEQPVKVFGKDFDSNNSVDAITACYFKSRNGKMELYPVHFWDELNSQSPKFRRKFTRYKYFGQARLGDILSDDDLEGALVVEMNYAATSLIENKGNNHFAVSALPTLAQVAPVNGITTDDFNKDGNLDVAMVGNDYGNEVFAGRYDAFTGLILLGDGKGAFTTVPSAESGFYVRGDAKGLVKLSAAKRDFFVATQNRDSLEVFVRESNENEREISPERDDTNAELLFNDGRKSRIEFYYGSGYLSQSSRKTRIPSDIKELWITDSHGKRRKIDLNSVR